MVIVFDVTLEIFVILHSSLFVQLHAINDRTNSVKITFQLVQLIEIYEFQALTVSYRKHHQNRPPHEYHSYRSPDNG